MDDEWFDDALNSDGEADDEGERETYRDDDGGFRRCNCGAPAGLCGCDAEGRAERYRMMSEHRHFFSENEPRKTW